METIKSQIDEDELETSIDPKELRFAYEWLMVEKSHKGQKWFLKEYTDKGNVLVPAGESAMYWAYETEIIPTLDDTRPTELKQLQIWSIYNHQNIPYYVNVLREEIPDSKGLGVPRIIRELWNKVEGTAA